MRGKLVPQDPRDEPASELLKQIVKEKARLVKAGEIRKLPEPLDVASADQPFTLPPGWQWVKLGDVLTKLTDGTHHSPPNTAAGDFKYITAKNIKDEGVSLAEVTYVERKVHEEIYSRCNPEKGDVLYIKDGATTGIVTVNDLDEPFSMLSSVALLKLPSCVFNRLIAAFLRSPFFYDQMRGFMKGAAITRVTLKRMAPALLPLTPLAEQHRIVAKVDELMALCDRLEAARAKREGTRDLLTAASLARLNAPDSETFAADAHFALNALPSLTTRPDQVKQLRQTILNLAVHGELVLQDAKDEPASELLKQIAKEKARLVKAGEIRKPKPLPNVDQAPFDIPHPWCWTRIREVTSDRGQTVPDKQFTYIDVTAIDKENGIVGQPKVLLPSEAPSRARKITCKGDVIYSCVRPYLLNVAVVDVDFDPAPIASTAFAILNGHGLVLARYLWIVLRSPFMVASVEEAQRGQAYPAINDFDFALLPFPLPPLAEQRRIAAKVDALLALCDQLEASLDADAATRRRPLDALLGEALAPAVEHAMEAAE